MPDFPVALTGAVDTVTEILAIHLNNLEAKVGIDASAVVTSLDYLLKNAASVDPGHKHSKLWASDGDPEAVTVDAAGNVGIGATAFGTSAAKVLGITSGTAPTSSPADMAQMWVQDIDGAAGKAGFHIRNESGQTGPVSIYGYAINVQALTSSPADATTVYFGMLPKAPVTVAATSKIYIRKAGTIKIVEIYCYSVTVGTNESWSLYIRKNNTTDTLIATLEVSASERVFSNAALSIDVAIGDYIEIKGVQPSWVINPLTTIYGGYVYIE